MICATASRSDHSRWRRMSRSVSRTMVDTGRILTGRVFLAADDFGDGEERAVGGGRVLEDFVERERGADDVFAHDVVQRQRVGEGLNAAQIDFLDLLDVTEDGLELGGEA